MGDNTLILGHRVSEWCGHAPVLEEDIALANTALDLIGQTQLWLGLAGEVEGTGPQRRRPRLPARRLGFPQPAAGRAPERRFRPHADAPVPVRRLARADAEGAGGLRDARIAEIAAKAGKEVAYHLERSADLVIRLGDGTEESHARMQAALDRLWPYAGEMFLADEVDAAWPRPASRPTPPACAPPGTRRSPPCWPRPR
jgi:ring-1,2-phenylacetyl-CoA epoxidase subunit PaaC